MSDKMREDFDVWAKAQGYELWVSCSAEIVCGLTTSVSVAPDYVNPETQKVWEAWQASRESIVIELTEGLDDGNGRLIIERVHAVEDIEAAGLKVSP